MLDQLARLLGVSTAVAAVVLALAVVQVATQAYALVDLVRRKGVRGGKKWVWAIVATLGGLLGAIVYLAVGRSPMEVDVSDSGAGGEAARRAVDVLYNPRDRR